MLPPANPPLSTAAHSPGRLGRRPALDGLRGIAILAVLGINSDWPFLQGGFFGVDVFFVLSGFLITTLLLEEWRDTGRIALGLFFKRRAVRLVPALAALLLFGTLYTLVFRPPEMWRPALQIIASAFFYVSNWVIGVGHVHGTLEHTWSLSVEGQFYLLGAIGLSYALKKGARPGQLFLGCVGLFVLIGLWRAVLWSLTHDVMRVYMGLDTRADALLAGCAIAFLLTEKVGTGDTTAPPGWSGPLTWLAWGVLLVGFTTFKYYAPPTFLGGFSLVALAAAVVLHQAVRAPSSLPVRFLQWPVLRWFGLVSYSIYLWHVPLKNLCSSERLTPFLHSPLLVEAARFAIFVAAGWISYRTIERPFLRFKPSRV